MSDNRVVVSFKMEGRIADGYKALSKKDRRTFVSVVNEALEDWLGTVGAARLEAPDRSLTLRNLITFPAPAATDALPVTVSPSTAPLLTPPTPITHKQ
jgi:hypothetical protein